MPGLCQGLANEVIQVAGLVFSGLPCALPKALLLSTWTLKVLHGNFFVAIFMQVQWSMSELQLETRLP